MNAKDLKKVMLGFVLVVMVFAVGRAVWEIKALQTKAAVELTLSQDGTLTMEQVIPQINAEMDTTKKLADTCVIVLECTPKQASNALYLVFDEKERIMALKDFLAVRAKAMAAYQAQDKDAFSAILPTYVEAKKKSRDTSIQAHDDLENHPSCKDLNAIFLATF